MPWGGLGWGKAGGRPTRQAVDRLSPLPKKPLTSASMREIAADAGAEHRFFEQKNSFSSKSFFDQQKRTRSERHESSDAIRCCPRNWNLQRPATRPAYIDW